MATSESTPATFPPRGFLEASLPARLILASFPLVTLPLAAALLLTTDRSFVTAYVWLFAITHFVITFTIYLQHENLRHFAATKRNIVFYIVIPLLIFAGFYTIGVFRLRVLFPAFALALSAAIRLLDFNHFSRQAFGVYQLFKVRTGLRWAASLKRTENAYFATLTALLYTTFLAGGIFPLLRPAARRLLGAASVPSSPLLMSSSALQALALALALAALILLATSVAGLLRAWSRAGRPATRNHSLRDALAYLAFQTLSALLGILSFPLYMATLAIHYVEYQVLMYPRCFNVKLDPASSLDAWFEDLRKYRVFFYLLLVIVAGIVTLSTLYAPAIEAGEIAGPATRYLGIVAIFDGLFVFHYFIEMFIWKFSDPFFRRTLSALYFAPRAPRS